MGADKQLLDVDGRPLVRAAVEPLLAAGAAGVVVVTRAVIAKQLELDDLGYVVLAINDDERSEMIDSIRVGLRAWRVRARWEPSDGLLVCPGDQARIARDDVAACVGAFRAQPGRIVIATRGGRRGHPIIVPIALVGEIESSACDGGLNELPRRHADRVVEVACASEGVTRDVDTPADYEQMRLS